MTTWPQILSESIFRSFSWVLCSYADEKKHVTQVSSNYIIFKGLKVKRKLLCEKQWYTMGIFFISIYPFKNNTPYGFGWVLFDMI